MKICNWIIEGGLLILFIFSPLFYGSIEIWSQALLKLWVIFLFLIWIVKMALQKSFSFVRTPLDSPILCLLSASLISRIFSIYPHASDIALSSMIIYIMLYYIIVNNLKSILTLERISIYIISIGGLLATIGLLRYLEVKFFLSLWPYGALSTYTGNGHLLAYVGMVMPLSFGLLLANIETAKKLYIILTAVLLITIEIICNDKGAWIQLGSALIFLAVILKYAGLLRRRSLTIILVVVLFIWGLSLYGLENIYKVIAPLFNLHFSQSPEASIWTRVVYWKDTLKIIKNYSLFGTGIGTFEFAYPYFRSPQQPYLLNFAHQDFLQLAAETGLFGLLIFIWLIVKLFKFGFSACRIPHQSLVKTITIGSLSGCFGLLIYSLYDFNLHIPANAILFVSLIALSISGSLILKQKGTDLKAAPYYLAISPIIIFLGIFMMKFYFANIHYEKGLFLEENLNFDEAIAEYEKAISLDSRDALYYSRLGNIYKIRSQFSINDKDYTDSAIRMFKKAQRLNPYNADHHIELADMYVKEDLPEMAWEEYKKAIMLDPNNSYYHYRLALYYIKYQKKDMALSELKIALDLNPYDGLARGTLMLLENNP